MRALCATIVSLLFAASISAQTESNNAAEPVTVIQKKWRIDVHNPALQKDAIGAMNEREEAERRRRAIERTNDMLVERGMPAQTSTVPEPSRETRRTGITVLYVYEVKVRNNGAKGIRKLTWDYAFFEPGTETELGRRRFISKVNIGPGGTSTVTVRAAAAPTGIVDARQAGKKPQDMYSEQVVIQRVEYADGSVWRPRSAR